LETHDDYTVVRYPASKWVCTSLEVDLTQDHMKGWQDKFENGMMAMIWKMQNKKNKNVEADASSIMFDKLFKYIIGVNSAAEQIAMTAPVTTYRTQIDNNPNMEKQEMCFWTGTPWEDKELPEPINEDVYLQDRESMDVFVRTFPGWAISHDDWLEQEQALEESISDRDDVDMENGWYTAGYNSPFELTGRTNDIWIPKMATEVKNKKNQPKSDRYDTISYNVLEKTENYELREYPESTWVCTSMVTDPTKDPMNGWEDDYANAWDAMANGPWEDQPSSQMFQKLFAYIAGMNADYETIDMTTPVTTYHTPTTKDNMETQTQCFWMGYPEDGKPPQPMRKDTFIRERKAMKLYVRQFGGWALSYDDYHKEYETLKADLKGKSIKENTYYDLSYNSPFEVRNRRNEIWIEQA